MFAARVTLDYLKNLILGPNGSLEVRQFDASILPFWVGRATSTAEVITSQGVRFLLIFPQTDLAADQLLFIYRQLKEKVRLPVIIVADILAPQVRAALTRDRCQSMITGRQLFAPELGISLNTKFEDSLKTVETHWDGRKAELSKTAHQVLVAVLMKALPEAQTSLSAFANIFRERVAPMDSPEVHLTVLSHLSRAVTQLEELQLLTTIRTGRERSIRFHSPTELWSGLCRYTKTTVSETALIPEHLITQRGFLILSGESALSHYSNLTAPSIPTYATKAFEFNELKRHRRISPDSTTNSATVRIEHWKIDPVFLFKGFGKEKTVNPIDLALSLRLEKDDRVRIAITEMLKKYELSAEPLWSY